MDEEFFGSEQGSPLVTFSGVKQISDIISLEYLFSEKINIIRHRHLLKVAISAIKVGAVNLNIGLDLRHIQYFSIS